MENGLVEQSLSIGRRLAAALSGYVPPILVAAFGVTLSLFLVNPFLSDAGDNASYMILAKSVATGEGYSRISEPGSPPEKFYPYGYPVLLAGQMFVIGSNLDLEAMVVPLKALNALFLAGALLLTYYLVAGWTSRLVALLTSLLVAISPMVLDLSSDIMSDIPFLFLSLAGIALVQKTVRAPGSLSTVFLASCVLAFAFYVRTFGVFLVVACLVYILAKVGLQKLIRAVLLLAIMLLPWVYQQTAVATETSYFRQFTDKTAEEVVQHAEATAILWADFAAGRVESLRSYATYQIPGTFVPQIRSSIPEWPVPAVPLVKLSLLVLLAFGFVRRLRSGPLLIEIYVVVSLLGLSFWWVSDRFLVPLLPFLALYFVTGAMSLGALISSRLRVNHQIPGLLAVSLVILGMALQDFSKINVNLSMRNASSPGEFYADRSPDYASFFRAAEWLRWNSPPDAVVMSLKPSLMHVYSGRKTLPSPAKGSPEYVLEVLESSGVSYIVEDSFTWNQSTSTTVAPAIGKYEDRFLLEHLEHQPKTRIWSYTRPAK